MIHEQDISEIKKKDVGIPSRTGKVIADEQSINALTAGHGKQRQREVMRLARDHLGRAHVICDERSDDPEHSARLLDREVRHVLGDHEQQERHIKHEEEGNQAEVGAQGCDAGQEN